MFSAGRRSPVGSFFVAFSVVLAGVMTTSLPASAQNLIQNGGFEAVTGGTCNATSWTTTGSCGPAYGFDGAVDGFAPHSGTQNFVFVTPLNPAVDTRQTVSVAAGSYKFSFWYKLAVGAPNTFTATVGSNVYSVVNASTIFAQFVSTVTLPAGNTVVAFTSTLGTSAATAAQIDDVSLTLLPAISTALTPKALTPNLPSGTTGNASNATGAIDAFTNGGGTLPSGFAGLSSLSSSQL